MTSSLNTAPRLTHAHLVDLDYLGDEGTDDPVPDGAAPTSRKGKGRGKGNKRRKGGKRRHNKKTKIPESTVPTPPGGAVGESLSRFDQAEEEEIDFDQLVSNFGNLTSPSPVLRPLASAMPSFDASAGASTAAVLGTIPFGLPLGRVTHPCKYSSFKTPSVSVPNYPIIPLLCSITLKVSRTEPNCM